MQPRPFSPPTHSPHPRAFPLPALALCALLAACGSDSRSVPRGKSLTLAEFKGSAQPASTTISTSSPASGQPPAAASQTTTSGVQAPFGLATSPGAGESATSLRDLMNNPASPSSREWAQAGVLDITTLVGEPVPAAPTQAAPPVGPPALIDSKVGDINGRPVYAGVFLAPMAERLRAEANRLRRDEWRRLARERINEELTRFIENELLRAEAINALTPEQKQGFFTFMRSIQQRVQSENLGSREAASQRIEETQGMSLDEYLREEEQRQLITFQINEKIRKRVSVSRRDVELEYARYYDTFNPPPKAFFRLVQIPADNADDIAAFERLRARGVPFAQIAGERFNRYKPDSGGLEERVYTGERAGAEFFGNADLNAAARTIAIGETAGPLTLGSSLAWLHLENIESRSMGLYEAQILIENTLRTTREREAKDRYVARLRQRASITDTDEMTRRLLAIAEARFYPPGMPEPTGPRRAPTPTPGR
ncbi:MAG: hypothetical protein KF859_07370 [Phycisphaeraceae bacterium]|nr:hypothetical protein [Phycisphaeraceae bacterium]